MRRNFFILWICLLLGGCVTAGVETTARNSSAEPGRLTNIHLVYPGMTSQDVRNIMGDQVVIGYKQGNENAGAYEILSVKSPYREETLPVKAKTYLVLYYFTSVKKSDDIIAEDELTPVVLEGDHVIARGWDDFFKLKN